MDGDTPIHSALAMRRFYPPIARDATLEAYAFAPS